MASSQRKFDLSFQFDGRLREFIVSIPTKLPPVAGYPVVMMLHGTSGDKDVYYNAHGWRELGQQENFITIFPSSLRWCFYEDGLTKNNTKFVSGDLLEAICPSDTSKLVDDIRFFRRIIQVLRDTLPVDSEKIFGSGFSNGCVMIFKTALGAGDLFKAVGGTGGILHELDSMTPHIRTPIYHAVGTLDDRFIKAPFTELPFGDDSILVYLGSIINRTLVCQGLTPKFTKTENQVSKTYLFNTCQSGVSCAPYIFTLIKDLDHQFPNGINHVIDAPQLFWYLFNNPPSINTSVHENKTHELNLSCFPNPTSDAMNIILNNGSGKSKVSLHNLNGTIVFSKEINGNHFKIEKSQIGIGIFYLQIENNGHQIVKKICFQ